MSDQPSRTGLPPHSPLISTSRGEKRGSPGALRLFYAVKVPDFIRERLMRLQGELGTDWRPVAPHQMHITLAFMGEVPESDLPEVLASGERVVASGCLKPFMIDLGDTGAFPNTRDPRVWFVEAKAPELPELAAMLHEDLKQWCDPKPFRPHLTLARRRADHARFVQATVGRQWDVTSFELIKSELKAAGPVYTVLHTFDLIPIRESL